MLLKHGYLNLHKHKETLSFSSAHPTALQTHSQLKTGFSQTPKHKLSSKLQSVCGRGVVFSSAAVGSKGSAMEGQVEVVRLRISLPFLVSPGTELKS